MTDWQLILVTYLMGTTICVVASYWVIYAIKKEGLENQILWSKFYKLSIILALFSWVSIFVAIVYHIIKSIKR